MASISAPIKVHWLRHGKVASHQGDIPLTDEGLAHIKAVGQSFRRELASGEVVTILHAPTRRTRDTAEALYNSLVGVYDDNQRPQANLRAPNEHQAIRNPDIYVAGVRVELVSSAEALAEQLASTGLAPEDLEQLPFWRGFWGDPDRIAYWVNHSNPPGEDADAVARRLLTFSVSLLDLPREQPWRHICVTHSPTMRAFLRCYLLGYDPGEPAYGESIDLDLTDSTVTIRYRDGYKKLEL
jgi:broad specificity phosphatase PhoE